MDVAQEEFNRGPAKWNGQIFGSLQEAYEQLRAIVDSSYDGMYITDGNAPSRSG